MLCDFTPSLCPEESQRAILIRSLPPFSLITTTTSLNNKDFPTNTRSLHHTPGTYHGSSSWFDACILRPLPPSTPRPPLAPDVAARIDLLQQRFGPPPGEPFPTFLVGNLLSHDPEDARDFLRSLGWDFVERVERVEVDGEVGERRGVLWKLQANVVASAEYHVHDGEWRRRNEHWVSGSAEEAGSAGSGDGLGFVDEMRSGDRVGIWARAMVGFFFSLLLLSPSLSLFVL